MFQNLYNGIDLYAAKEPKGSNLDTKLQKINDNEKDFLIPNYEGDFLCQVLVCVETPENQLIKDFLGKILSAVNLNFRAIALMNFYQTANIHLPDLIAKMQPKQILCFGIELNKYHFTKKIKPYELNAFDNTQFLWAEDLQTIETNQELKRKFWTQLQKMFPL